MKITAAITILTNSKMSFKSSFLIILLTIHQTRCHLSPGFSACKNFFYENTPPLNFPGTSLDICQKYSNKNYEKSRFATRFDKNLKIPIYSAYFFEPNEGKHTTRSWAIELEISGKGNEKGQGERFTPGKSQDVALTDEEKARQPMYSDYIGSGFSRGHLSPRAYHDTSTSQLATFTMTNVLPQREYHNHQIWQKLENAARKIMEDDCPPEADESAASAMFSPPMQVKNFFITGGIPGGELIKGKVRVPKYFFTAACCQKKKEPTESFSFGFISRSDRLLEEKPENYPVRVMNVKALGEKVARLWEIAPQPEKPIQFFKGDGCNPESPNSNEKLEKLKTNGFTKQLTFID